jgi:AcrR family transcriptional regulator
MTSRGQLTRSQIIQTAYHLSAAKGLGALHTRAVAEQAKINIATLHYYFPTKHDLQIDLLKWVLARFATTSQDKPSTLADELSEAVSWADTDPAMIALWHDFWNLSRTDSEVKQILHDHLVGWRSHLASLLQQHYSSVDATLLLALALGLPIVAATLPESWTSETLQAAVKKWIADTNPKSGDIMSTKIREEPEPI